jgi:hypothetical protein
MGKLHARLSGEAYGRLRSIAGLDPAPSSSDHEVCLRVSPETKAHLWAFVLTRGRERSDLSYRSALEQIIMEAPGDIEASSMEEAVSLLAERSIR